MRYYNDYGPMTQHYSDGMYPLIGMGLFLLFLIVIALIVARLVRRHGGRWAIHRDSIDIAKDRYAKGEITKEQYDQIKKDLS